MGRPVGKRNADYEARRRSIAAAIVPRLLAADGPSVSLRQLAIAAEVSVPTLVHYFGDRSAAIAAAIAEMHAQGAPHLARSATEPHGGARESLRWFAEQFVLAWQRYGVGRMVASSIAVGLHDAVIGPATVNDILEPTIQAAERRIADHVAAGEIAPCDVRHAALELVSPLLIALIHQDSLFGRQCRPLDLAAFLDDHLERFGRAYFAPSGAPDGFRRRG